MNGFSFIQSSSLHRNRLSDLVQSQTTCWMIRRSVPPLSQHVSSILFVCSICARFTIFPWSGKSSLYLSDPEGFRDVAYIARDDFCNATLPEQRYDPHIRSKTVSFHLYDYTIRLVPPSNLKRELWPYARKIARRNRPPFPHYYVTAEMRENWTKSTRLYLGEAKGRWKQEYGRFAVKFDSASLNDSRRSMARDRFNEDDDDHVSGQLNPWLQQASTSFATIIRLAPGQAINRRDLEWLPVGKSFSRVGTHRRVRSASSSSLLVDVSGAERLACTPFTFPSPLIPDPSIFIVPQWHIAS